MTNRIFIALQCFPCAAWVVALQEQALYFNFNGTPGTAPTGKEGFEATRTKVLFNITGSMSAPVQRITIRGIEIRDTALTYVDAHGMPSGGDWALARSVAETLLQNPEKIHTPT